MAAGILGKVGAQTLQTMKMSPTPKMMLTPTKWFLLQIAITPMTEKAVLIKGSLAQVKSVLSFMKMRKIDFHELEKESKPLSVAVCRKGHRGDDLSCSEIHYAN